MENYTVKKVLNNNVIIANWREEDAILVGKGIGFNSKKGEVLSKDKIEKVYIKTTSKMSENYNKVLDNIDNKIVGVPKK